MSDKYDRAVRTLVNHALDRTPHRYEGLCPDRTVGADSRDPRCPVCQAIDTVRVELFLRGRDG